MHWRRARLAPIDDEGLIEGVAGAILWKLAREHAAGRRTAFNNRECG